MGMINMKLNISEITKTKTVLHFLDFSSWTYFSKFSTGKNKKVRPC